MKLIRKSNEDEMILEFLKGELNSKRFNGSLDNIINDLGLDSSIIFNGNIKNKKENLDRLNIMKKFRGYPDNGLFENFPKISEWKYLELDEKALNDKQVEIAFRAAHTLKGVCMNLGFDHLYKPSFEITESLRAGNLELALQQFDAVKEQYSKTIAALNEFAA